VTIFVFNPRNLKLTLYQEMNKMIKIDKEVVEKVAEFHGHMCPGLAVGIRAAELALREIGPHSSDEEVVAIIETDM
jgi:formylmethanofuran dehydrogenase subunit E